MRSSLAASLRQDPTSEGHPAGSIVLCPDCWRPIYRLERSIRIGDRAGRAASAFAPLRRADVADLFERDDLDPTWRGLLRQWVESAAGETLWGARRPVAGDAAICPVCDGLYLRVRAVERDEVHDRAYALEMATIAPIRGRRLNRWIGHRPKWVRDPDPAVEVTVG